MTTPDLDQERLNAALELIGRCAANELELGWTDDAGPRPGEWYATASYKGARIIVEDQHGPEDAAEALALKLLAGGQCVHCGRVATAIRDGEVFTVAGHPVLDPSRLGQSVDAGLICARRRVGEHWQRGCDGGHQAPVGGLNREQRRRQAKAERLRR